MVFVGIPADSSFPQMICAGVPCHTGILIGVLFVAFLDIDLETGILEAGKTFELELSRSQPSDLASRTGSTDRLLLDIHRGGGNASHIFHNTPRLLV